MRTVPLGQAGVDASALCLGCMFFGARVGERTSEHVLDRYVDASRAFLDTANNYAFWIRGGEGGESEALLGRWMRRRGNRDRLFVATKVGGAPGEDLSRAAIRAAIDGSLRRLDTDHVDLYDAHIDHRSVALEETLDAFGELVTAGKVRHIGCSDYAAWRIERARRISDALEFPRYCSVQQRQSYLRPRPGTSFGVQLVADEGMLDFCAANPEVALLTHSPLRTAGSVPTARRGLPALLVRAGGDRLLFDCGEGTHPGAYSGPGRAFPDQYLGPDTDSRLAAGRHVAEATGASVNQVVLTRLMRRRRRRSRRSRRATRPSWTTTSAAGRRAVGGARRAPRRRRRLTDLRGRVR